MIYRAVVCLVVLTALAPSALALVMCQKKSGILVVRDSCRKKETAINPDQLGLRGPQGSVGPAGPSGATGPAGATGASGPAGSGYAWGFVVASGTGFHAQGGQVTLSVTHPATGVYCVVIPEKHPAWKAAQVTLAYPAGNTIVSVGTGNGSLCNPLETDTTEAIPVYVVQTDGTAVDENFTIVVP